MSSAKDISYSEQRPLTPDDWKRDFIWQCQRLIYLLDTYYFDLTTETRSEYLFRNLTNQEFDKLLDDPDAGRFAGIANKAYIPELRELLKNERIKRLVYDPYVMANIEVMRGIMNKLTNIKEEGLR